MPSVFPRFSIEGFLYHQEGARGRKGYCGRGGGGEGGRGPKMLIDAFINGFVKSIGKNLVGVSIHVPRE